MALDKFGARYGQAEGLQGQSYAIITKDLTKSSHPSRTKEQIKQQIRNLYNYANRYKDKYFFIAYRADTKNLNGYSNEEMHSMFNSFIIPDNIVFEKEFSKLNK